MRYIRPFEIEGLPGPSCEWLVSPAEHAGIAIRVSRGGGIEAALSREPVERFAIVLAGSAVLTSAQGRIPAVTGEVIFIPALASGAINGPEGTAWLEIEAALDTPDKQPAEACVVAINRNRFEGKGFAHQSLLDRTNGASALRLNLLQVQPGSGSPDWHIHAFTQMYLIQEGEMTIDIGRSRQVARAPSVVVLPAGVVHRNFNAADVVERHISLLVPEPATGDIFDYAVTIHEKEAELLTVPPL